MANTLGGLSLTVIAQEALNALTAKAPVLSAFTTDFSSDVAQAGAAVSTRIPTAFSSANDTAANGYSGQNAVSTAKTVTLAHRDVTVGFTDLEVSTMTLPKLTQTFIKPMINAVVESVLQSGLGLITTGTYTNTPLTTGVGFFKADHVADLAEGLSTAKVDTNDRALLVKPTYYAALAKDDSIQASYAYGGAEAIRDNKVPRVHGFDIYEYANLPANSQNIVGVAAHKSALVIATRQPAVPANFPGEVASATDPESNLTVQVRTWYDANAGQTKLAGTVMFGVAVGEPKAATIIKSS